MPNRIIKESVCTSDTIDQMTWFEECFYTRLWTACDDYGRMDARPAILKSKLFPLKERLSQKDVQNALQKMVDIGCVRLYQCDSKPYLYLPSWEVHQQIRAKRSRYPAPEDTCQQAISYDSGCPRNPIQSESISESESKSESSFCTEAEASSVPIAAKLPLNDKSYYQISLEQCGKWAELYPAVDIMQQLRAMEGWLDANPSKRKTKNGILRFVNGWLAREQDRGGGKQDHGKKPTGAPRQLDNEEREAIQRLMAEGLQESPL